MTVTSLIAASAFGSAHSALNSTAFVVARSVLLLLAIAFWIGLAFWTFRDARRRTDDSWLVGTAALLALAAPYVGPLVYLLVRPPETLDDVHSRELEVTLLQASLNVETAHCPVCRAEVEAGYLVCPVCTTRLREPCSGCGAPLESAWQMCPYCERPAGATPVKAPRVRALPAAASSDDLAAVLVAEAATNGDTTNGNATNGNGHVEPRPRSRGARTPKAPA